MLMPVLRGSSFSRCSSLSVLYSFSFLFLLRFSLCCPSPLALSSLSSLLFTTLLALFRLSLFFSVVSSSVLSSFSPSFFLLCSHSFHLSSLCSPPFFYHTSVPRNHDVYDDTRKLRSAKNFVSHATRRLKRPLRGWRKPRLRKQQPQRSRCVL